MSIALKALTGAVLALFLLGPCDSGFKRDDPYRVYSDLLREATSNSVEKPDYRLIVSKTSNSSWRLDSIVEYEIPGLKRDTIESFVVENAGDAETLRDRFYKDLNVIFIEEERIDEIFASGPREGWDEFYAVFPESTGFIRLSPVGFSKDGDQALLYVEHHSHGLAAGGSLVVARWDDTRWRIEASKSLWIA